MSSVVFLSCLIRCVPASAGMMSVFIPCLRRDAAVRYFDPAFVRSGLATGLPFFLIWSACQFTHRHVRPLSPAIAVDGRQLARVDISHDAGANPASLVSCFVKRFCERQSDPRLHSKGDLGTCQTASIHILCLNRWIGGFAENSQKKQSPTDKDSYKCQSGRAQNPGETGSGVR